MDGWQRTAGTLKAAGTDSYLPRLMALVGGVARHDRITVTRYAADRPPEFIAWHNFSAAQVRRYLAEFHPYDPFHRHWQEARRPGVVPLAQFGRRQLADDPYVADFLRQSAIDDEVGVLLADGPGATLGVFLERSGRPFARQEVALLTAAFPALAAIHDVHRRLSRTALKGKRPAQPPARRLPWGDLTGRERQVVELMLEGLPTATIAQRLGLSCGTVRNHRSHIYTTLDVTSERELLLRFQWPPEHL